VQTFGVTRGSVAAMPSRAHRASFASSLASLAVAGVFALVACKRGDPDATLAAPPASSSSSPPMTSALPAPTPASTLSPPEREDLALLPSEPLRKTLRSLTEEPQLELQRDALIKQFGDPLFSPMVIQIEPLPAYRRAFLIPGPPQQNNPLVVCVEADGTRAWTKETPLAGVVPGVHEMALVRGPNAGVSLAFCDSTQKLGALRSWRSDGGIFADYEVVETPHCDAISAMYWAQKGTMVVVAGEGEARIGRIAENGMRVWGQSGLTIPWKTEPKSAITMLVDTDDSFVVLGLGTTQESRDRHDGVLILAMRYNQEGQELWPRPLSVSRGQGESAGRLVGRAVSTGKMEVETGSSPKKRVLLTSEGSVVLLPDKR